VKVPHLTHFLNLKLRVRILDYAIKANFTFYSSCKSIIFFKRTDYLIILRNIKKNDKNQFKFNSDFLAYFQILKKYAIVRTLSVRPSVRPSVDDSTPQGIDRYRSFSAQSIAYGPRTCTKKGIFCRTRPGPRGDILVKISLYFHVCKNWISYYYSRL
jgi:hypothetical protein